MKKILLIIFMVCAICAFASSQEIIYVSAGGNDNNTGLSETEPLKTLSRALSRAEQLNSGRITVLGTLDAGSGTQSNRDAIFVLSANSDREILITGKPGASGSEKAILSANSEKSVVSVSKGNIRFEHIEITNAHAEGTGAIVLSRMTLGQGAAVKNNNDFGIMVFEDNAICTIDGGEIRNNNSCAVIITGGLLILKDGTIADNKANIGAGVVVCSGAKFEMQGGTITNNRAEWGTGVVIMEKGTFEMSGGTITRNRATNSIGGVWVQPGGTFIQNRRARILGNYANNTNLDPNVHRQ
jgi:hypothetical protein